MLTAIINYIKDAFMINGYSECIDDEQIDNRCYNCSRAYKVWGKTYCRYKESLGIDNSRVLDIGGCRGWRRIGNNIMPELKNKYKATDSPDNKGCDNSNE